MGDRLHEIVKTGDASAICDAIRAGANVNELSAGPFERRPLSTAISEIEDVNVRHEVVCLLLRSGADPRLMDDEAERLGPLFQAVLLQDAVSLRLLLDAGADPNEELGTDGESLYDWAEFDYRYECDWLPLPEEPTRDDKSSEQSWLDFLDYLAVKYGKPCPEHLRVLRLRGALRMRERRCQPRDDA